jgi:hypothetical protein
MIMNIRPENRDDHLDHLLDETLNSLKEHEAPALLLPNIMARVAEEEQMERMSWFGRLRWPVVFVSACSVLCFTFYSRSLFQSALSLINNGEFAGEIEGVNTGLQLMATLGNALSKVVSLVPPPILLSVVAAIFLFTAASCAGFGTVLFRLIRTSDSMTTHNAFKI